MFRAFNWKQIFLSATRELNGKIIIIVNSWQPNRQCENKENV